MDRNGVAIQVRNREMEGVFSQHDGRYGRCCCHHDENHDEVSVQAREMEGFITMMGDHNGGFISSQRWRYLNTMKEMEGVILSPDECHNEVSIQAKEMGGVPTTTGYHNRVPYNVRDGRRFLNPMKDMKGVIITMIRTITGVSIRAREMAFSP